MNNDLSLKRRLVVSAVLVPAVILFSWLGGWFFTLFIAFVIALATFELWRLFHNGGYSPSVVLMVVFVVLIISLRQLFSFQYNDLWLTSLILIAMVVHTLNQERGTATAATDFLITVGGVLYVGWLAAYAVSIRTLPNGLFWFLLVIVAIALADTGAYAIGRRFGRHKMLPVVSPMKSWEGYFAGVITGLLSCWGVAALFHNLAPAILPWHGLILGFVISVVAPLGDFGESMIKRQFNVKDASTVLLDHGGFLDRIDSILWALAIGYYLILLFIK